MRHPLERYFPTCTDPACGRRRPHADVLPHQREILESTEKYLAVVGGYGAGKTLPAAVLGVLLSQKVNGNVGLVARLELFSPFDAMDRIIVRNDYAVIAKVNEYITTNLTLNLINDVTVTPRTQVKQALTLGVTYNLL